MSEIEAALNYGYALTENGNSPIVESALVTCNQSIIVPLDGPYKAYAAAENNNTRNGAAGLRATDIVLKPESFGVCKVSGEACKPEIEGNKWQECDETHRISGEASVTMDSYMVCLKGGIISPFTDGQRIEELMEKHQELFTLKDISQRYMEFLKAYECFGDSWQYAQDLGDGKITIAYGVVLKDGDSYPLGKEVHDYWEERRIQNLPMTIDEAIEFTEMRMQENIEAIKNKAEKEGWSLNQNRYDAILDLTWNSGTGALQYNAAELLATGDLTDEVVLAELRKEILETAHAELEEYDKEKKKMVLVNEWSKNLVERKLDDVRIAQGGEDAYTKNEIDGQEWNDHAKEMLIDYGIEEDKLKKYPFQEVDIN